MKNKAMNLWSEDGGYIEAENWLKTNPNKYAFASNHFGGTSSAMSFVKALYKLGAKGVVISNTYAELDRIKDERGPYADALLIMLPNNKKAIAQIMARVIQEDPDELSKDEDDLAKPKWQSGEIIRLWWD